MGCGGGVALGVARGVALRGGAWSGGGVAQRAARDPVRTAGQHVPTSSRQLVCPGRDLAYRHGFAWQEEHAPEAKPSGFPSWCHPSLAVWPLASSGTNLTSVSPLCQWG